MADRMGMPNIPVIGQRSAIAIKEFQGHCQEFGIQKIYALPYHPQGNGVVESFHQF